MNCARAKDLLSPFYDGELSGELAAEVGLHAEHCPACRAELASFQQLGTAVCCAGTFRPAAGSWESLAARLGEQSSESLNMPESIVASESSGESLAADGGSGPASFGGYRRAAAVILALAASVLLFASLRTPREGTGQQGSAVVAAAVDYQDVFQLFEQQPQLALETLSERYAGREVSAEQAETMLGYRPSIASRLPSQARLVSTRVLKLPQCKCAGGKCTCGPGECNCAACLCERRDGSKFLVLEQCKTQDISFGDLPFKIAKRDSRDIQFVKAHDHLAVSWVEDNRRMTAIGLKDEAEAESLMNALDSPSADERHRG